ncbi:MAG: DUF1830 domain-containing protein [Microcoleus sp. PH2017_29_MFU_D_A]|jgi:hypothetical protein|uniref:DUF1830 domain-containing protein n=2 Tax=unclassified Microcoleus TaxID=2642155 RepID=UPI001DE994CA|nr:MULTISPECIES: DUF1830 domain-containing protein [unclassified Microcoleus]MCC3429541.1 DUF1830 domain-containing protein [Microcoleus sp. PH2017_04_SCI_O_A]MCC3435477.1 DUF1830 domain-containing protein [Microcoleus sp. PH2017_05_CCC_O_A]MCC3440451.1 DUF1830 domain-containing protein [Microcoleus sp. PH2017_03_ELD_O_A]MCC3453134.1 DUF1830 domain-containing protein [Microcoleus sp. PH2017_08_TRC_O_A]MCC3466383.1 DUF1830 domain-containing protein [Microcoleus sp. PH2017_06_SFM_O_A]MCC3485978
MNMTLTQVISERDARILCWYLNTTSQMQIARITNIPNWYFERTVFPGERFLFEALPSAQLEVCRSAETGAIVCERILCDRLRVEELSAPD